LLQTVAVTKQLFCLSGTMLNLHHHIIIIIIIMILLALKIAKNIKC